jgi:hypothetical protein
MILTTASAGILAALGNASIRPSETTTGEPDNSDILTGTGARGTNDPHNGSITVNVNGQNVLVGGHVIEVIRQTGRRRNWDCTIWGDNQPVDIVALSLPSRAPDTSGREVTSRPIRLSTHNVQFEEGHVTLHWEPQGINPPALSGVEGRIPHPPINGLPYTQIIVRLQASPRARWRLYRVHLQSVVYDERNRTVRFRADPISR